MIHLFSKCLLNVYFVSGPNVGAGDITMNKTGKSDLSYMSPRFYLFTSSIHFINILRAHDMTGNELSSGDTR